MNKYMSILILFVAVSIVSCSPPQHDASSSVVPKGVVALNPVIQGAEDNNTHQQLQEEILYFPNGRKASLEEVIAISPWDISLYQIADGIDNLPLQWVELRDGGKQLGWWGIALHYSQDIVVVYRYPPVEAFLDEAELDALWQELKTKGVDHLSPKFQKAMAQAIEEQERFLDHVVEDGSGLTTTQEICGSTVYIRDYHPERIIINTKTVDDNSPLVGSTVTSVTWSDNAAVIWIDSHGGSYHILDTTPTKEEDSMPILLDLTRSVLTVTKPSCKR
jgi:hypothetical protein